MGGKYLSDQFKRLQQQAASQQTSNASEGYTESNRGKYLSDQFKHLQRQATTQLASVVDEGYISSFLSDAKDYVSQIEADSKAFDWATATSQQATDKRNESNQAMKDRATRIRAWFSVNKNKISAESYQQYMQYLDGFSGFLDQSADAFEKSSKAFSKFATEEEYNRAVTQSQWRDKYSGMSLEQIKKTIATLPDGDEKTWLESYTPATMTDADYEYEIADTNWTLDRLNAVLEEYKELTRWEQDAAGREREAELRSRYGDITELEALISNKEAYRNLLKYEQEGKQLSSVIYNEDFNDYKQYTSSILEDALNDDPSLHLALLHQAMLPGEKDIYCYHYAKNGKEVAERYLYSIREAINERLGNAEAKPLKGNTLRERDPGKFCVIDAK